MTAEFIVSTISTIVIGGLTIFAIIWGPIKALQIQRKLDESREARNRKLAVFKTLMSFRATRLAPAFVQALNMIDVEFDSPEEKEIRDAWKELLDQFSDWGKKSPQEAEKDEKQDNERAEELLTELLMKMGKSLGYKFDRVQIKKGAYSPLGHGRIETEQNAIRRGLLEVLAGQRYLPVALFEQKFPAITVVPGQGNKMLPEQGKGKAQAD